MFIQEILSLFQLRKEVPVAVGYSYIRPMLYEFPVEIENKLSEPFKETFKGLLVSHLFVENLNSKAMRNIRIKLYGEFEYASRLDLDDGSDVSGVNRDLNLKEITVERLDPGARLWLTLFPKLGSSFQEPVVLIDDHAITKSMKRLGFLKSHPWFMFTYTLLIGVVLFTGYIAYGSYKESIDLERMNATLSKFSVCTPYWYENPVGNREGFEREVEKNKSVLPMILSFNEVASIEELSKKESILFCKSKT